MEYNITEHTGYRLATITEQKTALFVVHITIDIHQQQSVCSHAVELIYADALLSGAGKYDRASFLDAVNSLGASIGVSTSHGQVHLTLKGQNKDASKLLKLFQIMMQEPAFAAPELKRIKLTTTNELHDAQEDSKGISHHNLTNLFYDAKDRHYTPSLSATKKAVQTVSKKDLSALHKHVHAQSWTVSATSDKATLGTLTKTLNQLRKGFVATQNKRYTKTKKSSGVVELVDIPSRSNIDVNFGAAVPITLTHPDYVPLKFGLNVLAKWGGFSGRLMSTVREKEGLTYGIYGTLEGFLNNEFGYWRIMSFFAPDKIEQGITSTMREIKKIHQKGITLQEFEHFKSIMNTQQTLLGDSVYKLLKDLHAFHSEGFTLDEMRAFKAKIDTLTRTEVNQAVKTYLNPANVNLSCAGPIEKVRSKIKNSLQ